MVDKGRTKEKTKEKAKEVLRATGRRKEASARVRLIPQGKGRIIVNGIDYLNYFPTIDQRIQIERPIETASLEGKIDVLAKVRGGGQSGQAGAIGLGIARCLLELNPSLRGALRREHFLTRDPRAKERKKYGRKGARRRFQWTKR